jgi:16S rRNA (guanine966-N2)-methyltransferase
LRIIAGKYKSRKVNSPVGANDHSETHKSGIRPTSDRARESLFNILFNIIDFDEVVCLDLFAGTGALGFECISRGAMHCDFVDISKRAEQLIRETSEELDCTDKVFIIKDDALRFVHANGKYYDIIFADPPYMYDDFEKLIRAVLEKEFGIFVVEYGNVNKQNIESDKHDIKDRAIGTTNFRIYISKDND